MEPGDIHPRPQWELALLTPWPCTSSLQKRHGFCENQAAHRDTAVRDSTCDSGPLRYRSSDIPMAQWRQGCCNVTVKALVTSGW